MAVKSKIHAIVAVPNFKLFEGDIYYANVPSTEGYYGILPGHELSLSLNKSGGVCTLHLDEKGTDTVQVLLYDGIAQVMDNQLTVLGRLGKLTTRIHLDEMQSRRDAQQKIVDEAIKTTNDEDSAEKIALAYEKEKLEWYELQVQWAQNNNK